MITCRHCGAEFGHRANYVKRGDVLQLWYGQWSLDPDGVWRRKKRIRRPRFDPRGGGDPPLREGFDWMTDPDHDDDVYWRIWVPAEIECPSCKQAAVYTP